ncbi:hypothetical protein [Psychromonas ingrahamii]|nr:hypothetical protein [Psychromonas ingrahamii]
MNNNANNNALLRRQPLDYFESLLTAGFDIMNVCYGGQYNLSR